MSRLTLDATSARTLPYLDKLYLEGKQDKLSEIISSTPPEILRRLTLAALARNTQPARGISANVPGARLLETVIQLNLTDNAEAIPELLSVTGKGEVMVLTASIIRYNIFDVNFE